MRAAKLRAAKNPTAMRDPGPTKSCRSDKILAVRAYIKFQKRRGFLSLKFHRVDLRSRILKF